MDRPKYRIEVFWSDEDGGYIANVPALRYCSAFGETYEEALREVLVAMELHLDTLRELDRPIPDPIPDPKASSLSKQFFEIWVEALEEHSELTLSTSSVLEELFEAQRRAFQESSQEATEAYMDFLNAAAEEQRSRREVPRRPATG